MKKILIFLMVLLFCATALARPTVSDATNKLGGFSGDGGANQDDSSKASLDLAHTDLDAIIASLGIVRQTNSSIFYVDVGISGATGVSWATAVLDVEAATVLCTASAGDIIVIAPGHVETMAATDDIDLDKIGVIAIGLGQGDLRPTFSYTASGEFVLGADNTAVYNCRFIATSDSVVHAIDVEANVDGWGVYGCEFSAETTTTDEFDDVITISTLALRGVIDGNKFLGDIGTNTDPQSCINFNTAHYLQITNNEFYGDRGVACIENAAAANFPIIKDNMLFNGIIGGTAGLNAQPVIELHASTSALIVDNDMFCAMTEATAIVAADGFLTGNTYNESEGSGTSLEVGKSYVRISNELLTTSAGVDMFNVLGGQIHITSMFGVCTTVIGSTPGALDLHCDATTENQDRDFTTAVNCDSVTAGSLITFDSVTAGESVLVATLDVGANEPVSWFCPIGMIEQRTNTTGSGGFTWYMTFTPLVEGVTVTVQ